MEDEPRIDNHQTRAILAMMLCFLVTGIVAVVYSTKVDRCLKRGDREGAEEASRLALWWSNLSIALGLLFGLASVVYDAVAGYARNIP